MDHEDARLHDLALAVLQRHLAGSRDDEPGMVGRRMHVQLLRHARSEREHDRAKGVADIHAAGADLLLLHSHMIGDHPAAGVRIAVRAIYIALGDDLYFRLVLFGLHDVLPGRWDSITRRWLSSKPGRPAARSRSRPHDAPA